MKVLITGGAGYIGSHTNRYLTEHGIQTLVLDNLCDGHQEAVLTAELINGDFGDSRLLDKIFNENEIDAVMHFAAFASVADSVKRPDRYYQNNVTNMKALLDACVKHKIKYFIFSSSAASYGDPVEIPMTEKHPQNPINPYGETKLIGERLLMDYERAYGIKHCIFRYFNAAGASKDALIGESHDPETHLIPVMINAALSGKPFSVFGNDYDTPDGSCIRDYVHVLDIAEAHYLGLKYLLNGNTSDSFNLGSNRGYSVLEMTDALSKIMGKTVPCIFADRREGDPKILLASNRKAKEILNWEAKHSGIDEILKDALNWEKNRRY